MALVELQPFSTAHKVPDDFVLEAGVFVVFSLRRPKETENFYKRSPAVIRSRAESGGQNRPDRGFLRLAGGTRGGACGWHTLHPLGRRTLQTLGQEWLDRWGVARLPCFGSFGRCFGLEFATNLSNGTTTQRTKSLGMICKLTVQLFFHILGIYLLGPPSVWPGLQAQ